MFAPPRLSAAVFQSAAVLLFVVPCAAAGERVEVGPGRAFDSPAAAVAAAGAGGEVVVFPRADGRPYEAVAVRVRVPGLTLRAATAAERDEPGGGGPVTLSGAGADLSGAGPAPRAVVQFDPAADGGTLAGFTLTGARNDVGNAAGVRISGADRVTVRGCEIRGNDMGVMSDGRPRDPDRRAAGQRIEHCRIHRNGAPRRPGLSHNLYLGGTSVTLRGCDVHHSATGHNVKSRARLTRVEYCHVHDSADREFDLVDAKGVTDYVDEAGGADAVLVGNLIVKADPCLGNTGVIHFGRDGAAGRTGALRLVHNTIVTPHRGPLVELSSAGGRAALVNNAVWGGGAAGAAGPPIRLARAALGGAALTDRADGAGNWFSPRFAAPDGLGFRCDGCGVGAGPAAAPFANAAAGDFMPRGPLVDTGLADPLAAADGEAPGDREPRFEYDHETGVRPRSDGGRPDAGAFGAG